MFTHLSVPNALFSFSTHSCLPLPVLLLSSSSLFSTSRYFMIYPFLLSQVDTIPKLFWVCFPLAFSWCVHISLTAYISHNLPQALHLNHLVSRPWFMHPCLTKLHIIQLLLIAIIVSATHFLPCHMLIITILAHVPKQSERNKRSRI